MSDPEKSLAPNAPVQSGGLAQTDKSADPNTSVSSSDEVPDGESAPDAEEAGNRRARRAAAARSRKQRVREREEAQAIGLDAQEIIDDALVRSTDTAGKWLKKNANFLQWIFVGGITVWAGWGLYGWQQGRSQAAAADKFAKAANAQFGKVGADNDKEENPEITDPTPVFADDKARIEAAKAAFEDAAKRKGNDGTGQYTRLALGAVLLDQAQFDDAKVLFDEVAASKFAQTDAVLKTQALEGLALALEGKGDKAGALAAYERVATQGSKNTADLAKYNQARLLRELNRVDDAKKLVTELYAQMPPKEGMAGMFPGYLEQSVKVLASALGVEAPKPIAAITPAEIKDLAASVQKSIGQETPPATGTSPAPSGAAQ